MEKKKRERKNFFFSPTLPLFLSPSYPLPFFTANFALSSSSSSFLKVEMFTFSLVKNVKGGLPYRLLSLSLSSTLKPRHVSWKVASPPGVFPPSIKTARLLFEDGCEFAFYFVFFCRVIPLHLQNGSFKWNNRVTLTRQVYCTVKKAQP